MRWLHGSVCERAEGGAVPLGRFTDEAQVDFEVDGGLYFREFWRSSDLGNIAFC